MKKNKKKSRSGLIVAFIGIDGSGKSTVIEQIKNLHYPEHIRGVKEMYFGNHGFWLPGLNLLFKYSRKKKGLIGAIAKGLAAIDIKFRALPALFARRRKKIVLCDRYYYDQLIGDPVASFTSNKILKKLLTPLVVWVPLQPDLTVFLKIDPETAYSRQQGLTLEQEKKYAMQYDELFHSVEALVVDANRSIEQVVDHISREIMFKLGDEQL